MNPNLLRLIKAHYASTKMKIRSGVRHWCALSPTLFKFIIDCSGVQIWVNVRVLVPTMVLSNDYREMISKVEAVNHHAEAKVISALIRGGFRQVQAPRLDVHHKGPGHRTDQNRA